MYAGAFEVELFFACYTFESLGVDSHCFVARSAKDGSGVHFFHFLWTFRLENTPKDAESVRESSWCKIAMIIFFFAT